MKIILNDVDKAMLMYILRNKPPKSTFSREFAKAVGITVSEAAAMARTMYKFGLITYIWDGIRESSKRYITELNGDQIMRGEIEVRYK